jgi:hypothetical protein
MPKSLPNQLRNLIGRLYRFVTGERAKTVATLERAIQGPGTEVSR